MEFRSYYKRVKFNDFLKQLKTKFGMDTSRELYQFLGGAGLGMTLRNFQMIESGKVNPSLKVLVAVFDKIPSSEFKEALISFFESSDSQNSGKDKISEYLKNHLGEGFSTSISGYEGSRSKITRYSQGELEYLTVNDNAARLFHWVLLSGRVSLEGLKGYREELADLKRLGLVSVEAGYVTPSRNTYQLPTHENSTPAAVRAATRYMLSVINRYISYEGSDAQFLGMASQGLPSAQVAEKVNAEALSFKKWVQSQAIADDAGPTEESVRHVFFCFSKHMPFRLL